MNRRMNEDDVPVNRRMGEDDNEQMNGKSGRAKYSVEKIHVLAGTCQI